jgi:hypothetical protein
MNIFKTSLLSGDCNIRDNRRIQKNYVSVLHPISLYSSPSYVITRLYPECTLNIQIVLYMTFRQMPRKIAQNLPFSQELLQIYEVVVRLS